jgi:hypothetical protein
MSRKRVVMTTLFALIFAPALAFAQIDFPKTGYYDAAGDSVAAGEGSLPITSGYVYEL